MEILNDNSLFPKDVALVLGFFDGIHLGHRKVIRNTPSVKKVVATFSASPMEYFGENVQYIYTREMNYKLLENLGVDYIYEQDFSTIANLSASEYLKSILSKFKPKSITTGFNHTFGANKQGNPNFLKLNNSSFEYFCTEPCIINEQVVSSSKIKEFLSNGNIEDANVFLGEKFKLKSTVIEGEKLGRELGFPTANMKYPPNIQRIPYGVYKVNVLGRIGVMNWGIKPTFGANELLEVHITNYKDNLYGKELEIELVSKIRNEKKFSSLNELKVQINKDINQCLEL